MKTRWKLTREQQYELALLYLLEGWNVYHLSYKFGIQHQSVHYYVIKYELERKVPKLKKPPEEVSHLYKPRKKVKTYKDYLQDMKKQRI